VGRGGVREYVPLFQQGMGSADGCLLLWVILKWMGFAIQIPDVWIIAASACLPAEKGKIQNYLNKNDILPPGNRIIK